MKQNQLDASGEQRASGGLSRRDQWHAVTAGYLGWTLDAFDFFRWVVSIIATIYATVVTLQSLWGWYVWLSGSDKYVSMLRRYLVVHSLRLRFKTFWGDVLICLLLCVAFFIIWHAQILLNEANEIIKSSKIKTTHVQRTVQHS